MAKLAIRRNLFWGFALASGVAITALPAAVGLTQETEASERPAEIKIASTEFEFVPAKIWAVAGRPVTIILDNSKAETEHGIDVPAIGFRLVAMAGEIARKTAVFDQTGEFQFTCDLPGHREAGMKGIFIIGRF